MRFRNIIFHNIWPKLISLILAIATWFYVFDIINRDSFSQRKKTAEEVFSRYKFMVKEVPVKPVFVGKSPEGYRVDFDKVRVEPSTIAIFGPRDVIGQVNDLRTDKINLGEYTRSVRLQLSVHSDLTYLRFGDNAVDVHLPVEPEEKPEQEP